MGSQENDHRTRMMKVPYITEKNIKIYTVKSIAKRQGFTLLRQAPPQTPSTLTNTPFSFHTYLHHWFKAGRVSKKQNNAISVEEIPSHTLHTSIRTYFYQFPFAGGVF